MDRNNFVANVNFGMRARSWPAKATADRLGSNRFTTPIPDSSTYIKLDRFSSTDYAKRLAYHT
jgi:hypothetical protein